MCLAPPPPSPRADPGPRNGRTFLGAVSLLACLGLYLVPEAPTIPPPRSFPGTPPPAVDMALSSLARSLGDPRPRCATTMTSGRLPL